MAAAASCSGLIASMTPTATVWFMIRTEKRPRCGYSKRLNAELLRRDDKGKSRVAVLDALGISLEPLARTTVKLTQ